MSGLFEILAAHDEAIRRTLAEKLRRVDAPAVSRAKADDPALLLETLRATVAGSNEDDATRWCEMLSAESGSPEVPHSEVLAVLHCLERVTSYYVVKEVSQKKALLPALGELSEAVDHLRHCCIDSAPVELVNDPVLTYGFVGLTNSSDDFVCLIDSHGEPLYLNPAGRRMVGLNDDAPLPSTKLHDYYSDESWQQLRDEAVPAVNRHGSWKGRSRLRNVRTGQTTDVQTTVYRIKSPEGDQPSCLAVVHRQAEDREQIEAALAESQARKRAILESSLDPIITINHEGVITEFNRAAEQVFGHSRQQVLGTQPSEVLFPPDASADEQNRIDRYLDAGEGSMLGKRIEVTAVRANGETFPAEMAMTISHEQGAPVLSFFVRDISQRKQAEREQARYAAELERSNRELEQFAYVASHDLQEPLRKIRTFSDRLEMKYSESLDETGRECIQRMQSAAARMQMLIEGLLTLSRVTTRAQGFEPVDLAQVAREVVSDLEVQIDQADGRVEVGKLPRVQADPLQVRQLLQNLIGNAIKFHRVDEPPVVSIEGKFVKGRAHRRLGESAAEEQCRLLIKDNGIGFDEQYCERIFDVFQRLHPRDVYEGTGVGLAICRKIVERHGGTISARSAPGRGSTFEILLPVVHASRKKT